jgi:hypothetical protein
MVIRMGYGSSYDMYLSKKPKGKWPQSRLEQRKQKMFGTETVQENIDKMALPLKQEQAEKRGEKYE